MQISGFPRFPLAIALCLSVLIHLGVGALIVTHKQSDGAFLKPVLNPEKPDQPQEQVELGLRESPHVSINWLGFEDPTEHRTTQAETDQAAQSIPRADQPVEAVPTQTPIAPTPATPPRPAQTPAHTPAPQQASPETQPPANTQADASEQQELPEPPPALAPPGERVTTLPPTSDAPGLVPLEAPSEAPKAPESQDHADKTQQATTQPKPEAQPQTEPKQQVTPVPPTNPALSSAVPAQAEKGDPDKLPPSDRDSDPTSREMVVTTAQLGRPMAGEGIEVIPVRPDFSITTLLLSSPRNPLIQIEFGKNGAVRRAFFVKDEEGRAISTGSSSVDQPLLDAVYRWKAKGERIEALQESPDPNVVIVIRMRIKLR